MSIVKAYRYPVSIQWQAGRLTRATVPGKTELEVATPPEFKSGIPGVWSPEDLLVAATAACYAVTLLAVAESRRVTLIDLHVDGTGHVERRADGRFAFVAIELVAAITTEPEQVTSAEKAARYAKDACVVSLALDTPVHLDVLVATREVAPVA